MARVAHSSTYSPSTSQEQLQGMDLVAVTKRLIQDFLCRLRYRPPGTLRNETLRSEVVDEVKSWNLNLGASYVDAIADTAATIVECTYAHTSYEHQRFAAIYSVCLIYVDDTADRIFNAIRQFGQRLVTGQPQLDPALERLAALFQTVHALYPSISADAIVTNTIDRIAVTCVEVITKGQD